MPLTVGTAGHVDHGKTTLVKALTGTDTDRLAEERARGLSIVLGYAALELPDGRRLSVIDVPGHERFVRTMVAGATGIDLFLMVVAADDGVMPQTREHAAVLRALGVDRGVVAITKTDLADPARAAREAADLLPGTPVCLGSESLREELGRLAVERPRSKGPGPLEHVDRVFTVRGAGTVVTGTLWQGSVRKGDRLRAVGSGREVRVRGVQVHDGPVDEAAAGQRVALNLAGVSPEEIAPGEALAGADVPVVATRVLDARLDLRDARHNQRVQVHHGTRAVAGRIADRGEHWQLRLERPLLAQDGDRVVIRSIAPPATLGGGVILRADARSVEQKRGLSPPKVLKEAPRNPSEAALALADELRAAGHEPPRASELDPALLSDLRAAGLAIRVGDRYAHPEAVAAVRSRVEALAPLTLAQLRDDLGTSRQFAQAWLEHFDAAKVTRRQQDDSRVLRVQRSQSS